MKQRIDLLLLKRNLVSSRNQAADLVKEGYVYVNGEKVLKASLKFEEDVALEIKKDKIFVGRGAHKMEGAYSSFNLSFTDMVVGDMGASTGGFSEFALLKGAKKIYAVDVGIGQLATKLKDDERVTNLEGVNIRDGLSFRDCDIVVADLSFISLLKVIVPMMSVLKDGGEFVLLVKPQFEVGKAALGKNGIVKDVESVTESVLRVIDFCHENGLSVKGCRPCLLKGKMGNQEYFIYGVKNSLESKVEKSVIEDLIKATL
jgi:23S rRNA (cytidine1920-2'-O)/16S rRNA (cytidine1409-2'-O)-methyltransferase